MKKLLMGAVAISALAIGVAQATPLTGTFTIDVYNGNGGGLITSPGVQALNTNPLINNANKIGTVTYTGALNFFLGSGGTNTIKAFLDSGGGSYSCVGTCNLGTQLSSGGFNVTTVLDIFFSQSHPMTGTITHDDGIGLYENGVLTTGVPASAPTVIVPTAYATGANASLELVYVAANSLPEQLTFDVATIPEPVTLSILGTGLLGLGLTRMRRRAV